MPHHNNSHVKSITMIRKKSNPTKVTDDMKLLLPAREAALVCGISLRTWRMWDSLGYTPQPVHIGRSLFWKYQELVAWIDAGCPKRDDWAYRK